MELTKEQKIDIIKKSIESISKENDFMCNVISKIGCGCDSDCVIRETFLNENYSDFLEFSERYIRDNIIHKKNHLVVNISNGLSFGIPWTFVIPPINSTTRIEKEVLEWAQNFRVNILKSYLEYIS